MVIDMKTPSVAELKKMAKEREHVLLSQSAYDELKARARPEYVPTAAERRMLKQSMEEYREGKFISLDELKRAVGR